MSHTQRRLTHATFFPPAFTVVARRVVTTHDVVMEAMTCRMRWIRPGVRLGATSVEADKSDGGLGVKAPRMKTSRGIFLGGSLQSFRVASDNFATLHGGEHLRHAGGVLASYVTPKARKDAVCSVSNDGRAGTACREDCKLPVCPVLQGRRYQSTRVSQPHLQSFSSDTDLTPIFRCSQSQKLPSSLRCLVRCAGSRASLARSSSSTMATQKQGTTRSVSQPRISSSVKSRVTSYRTAGCSRALPLCQTATGLSETTDH